MPRILALSGFQEFLNSWFLLVHFIVLCYNHPIEVSINIAGTDMSPRPPTCSHDLTRLLFASGSFALLSYLFLYLLPLVILQHPLFPLQVTLWTSLAVATTFFFCYNLFSGPERDRLLSHGCTCVLLLAILYGLFAGLIIWLDSFFPGNREVAIRSFLFFLLAVSLLFHLLRPWVQHTVDRFFLNSQPDYRSLLCDFSGRIASSLHLPDLVNVLVHELPGQLQITGVGLMIMEEKRSRLYPENLRFGSHLWSESRLIQLLRDGHHFFFCKPGVDDPKLSGELQEIEKAGFALVYGLQGGSQFGGMLLLGPRKDGKLYSSLDVQAFSTLANQVTIAVENALNYETLSDSKEQLQLVHNKMVQAEKMAALGEMTAILAHELKNPMGIIRSSAQFLLADDRNPEMQQELLHYIVDEVDNLNLVINNLLGLARHKPPRFRKVDLKKEVTRFVSRWQQCEDHNRNVRIHLVFPEHQPILYADFKQLRQVMLNCIANSEEVMPAGGEITIAAREIDRERLEIRITDTGPGLAEDDLKLVFKKFFTTKEKGVGLGLPVCRQIIRAHNGSIVLVNRETGGAAVVIRLPLRPLVTIGAAT